VNVDKYLAKLKKDLGKMEPDETHDIDCGSTVCTLCRCRDSLPADEALIGALFFGHDLALGSTEARLHVLNRHFCKIHIRLFHEFMKMEKRDSFGK